MLTVLPNTGGFKVGMILTSSQRIVAEQVLHFKASNNEAEYEALLAWLRLTCEPRVQHLKAFSDFQPIVEKLCKELDPIAPTMERYL